MQIQEQVKEVVLNQVALQVLDPIQIILVRQVDHLEEIEETHLRSNGLIHLNSFCC